MVDKGCEVTGPVVEVVSSLRGSAQVMFGSENLLSKWSASRVHFSVPVKRRIPSLSISGSEHEKDVARGFRPSCRDR